MNTPVSDMMPLERTAGSALSVESHGVVKAELADLHLTLTRVAPSIPFSVSHVRHCAYLYTLQSCGRYSDFAHSPQRRAKSSASCIDREPSTYAITNYASDI